MSKETIHAALVRCTGSSCSIVLASLIHSLPTPDNLNYFPPFYLHRIKWLPVAAPIAMYVFPAVVRFLEGWTNRFNNCALVYAGLTDEAFRV